MINQFVDLEEKVSFISKKLSGHVLILISVKYIILAHNSQDCFDQVLEPFVNNGLHPSLKLHRPFSLGKIILEVLFNFLPH